MPQRNRYFIWRGIGAVDGPVDELIARSQEYDRELTRVTDDFAVVHVTEDEIIGAFPSVLEGQILIPSADKGCDDDKRYDEANSFKTAGDFLLGIDAPVALSEYAGRRNARPGGGAFDRFRAENLIDAQAIRDFAACGARKVNVVIVDGGLDEGYLKSIGYAKSVDPIPGMPGLKTRPHVQQSQRHANVVARSILSIAPDVQLIDAPILPDRIDTADLYASSVIEMVIHLLGLMAHRSDESWIMVCAWGLVDRKYDRFIGTYADDHRHMLSSVIKFLETRNVDVVFSAGNSGLFWPDISSGHTDRGPARSIMGANGLRSVLTVGGVDATGDWIGESSQGPEPRGLRTRNKNTPRKPDICAPTWFRENDDRNALVTGTSGACAVAAGVVAALRRRVDPAALPPAELIEMLRKTARTEGYTKDDKRATPAEWRMGSGIIDCAALVRHLLSV